MKVFPHSSNLRLHRWSDASATFFVTKSLHPKKPALNDALFALIEPWTLPKFMHAMMSFVGAKMADVLQSHRTSWQDGYYDTHIKTAKQFEFVTFYIEQNPVKKELAERPNEWDASSAKRRDLIAAPWPFLLDEE